MSFGTEDLVAAGKKGEQDLYVQAKNHSAIRIVKGKTIKVDPAQALDIFDREILKRHAQHYGAEPIFLYKNGRGKDNNIWLNLRTGQPVIFQPFTEEWYEKRSKIKKLLRELKDPKKGGSKQKYQHYVLENWDEVCNFIC